MFYYCFSEINEMPQNLLYFILKKSDSCPDLGRHKPLGTFSKVALNEKSKTTTTWIFLCILRITGARISAILQYCIFRNVVVTGS